MRVKLNGQPIELADGLTLEALLADYRLKKEQVVVEHNYEVPDKAAYGATRVKDGDVIEIVKFMGGG